MNSLQYKEGKGCTAFPNFVPLTIRLVYTRTASDMDGTLHTDLARFENIRDIKKVLYNHFNNLKS